MSRLIAMLLAGALLLAACGGTPDSNDGVATLDDGTDTTAPVNEVEEPADAEEALMALVECLREEGIDMPDPTVDAEGNPVLAIQRNEDANVTFAQIEEAMEVCGHLAEGVTRGMGQEDMTEMQDMVLEFAACMREQGIDFPDPDFAGGGVMFGGDGLDPDDPAFVEAMEECDHILAGFGGGGAGMRTAP